MCYLLALKETELCLCLYHRIRVHGTLYYRLTGTLVYQAPDWACYINAVALNRGSIYGDLVIAQAESTP